MSILSSFARQAGLVINDNSHHMDKIYLTHAEIKGCVISAKLALFHTLFSKLSFPACFAEWTTNVA